MRRGQPHITISRGRDFSFVWKWPLAGQATLHHSYYVPAFLCHTYPFCSFSEPPILHLSKCITIPMRRLWWGVRGLSLWAWKPFPYLFHTAICYKETFSWVICCSTDAHARDTVPNSMSQNLSSNLSCRDGVPFEHCLRGGLTLPPNTPWGNVVLNLVFKIELKLGSTNCTFHDLFPLFMPLPFMYTDYVFSFLLSSRISSSSICPSLVRLYHKVPKTGYHLDPKIQT